MQFFSEELGKFFKSLLFDSIEYREKNKIVVHDMVNLLMQVRKHGSMENEDDEKYKDVGFATVEESKSTSMSASKTKSMSQF